MSQHLVNQYLNDLDRYKKISGSLTEGVISEAFKDLLKAWSRQSHLTFINQYEFVSNQKTRIRPDGTILHDLRVPLGYWAHSRSSAKARSRVKNSFRSSASRVVSKTRAGPARPGIP